MQTPVGDDFQKETKYTRNENFGGNLDWSNKPETYKSYPNSKAVRLPSQLKETTTVFTEVIQKTKKYPCLLASTINQNRFGFSSLGVNRHPKSRTRLRVSNGSVRWRVIPNRDICCSK